MEGYGPPQPWMHHRHPHPWGGGLGQGPDPSMAFSALNTVFWIILFIGIVWMLLWWVLPYVKPIIANFLGSPPSELSALDVLRQRYAAGEIDAETFAQMRIQIVGSYQPKDIRHDEDRPQHEIWKGYRDTLPSPGSYGQEKGMMMEQEQYRSDGE
jgi:uncharacterized membrane protein